MRRRLLVLALLLPACRDASPPHGARSFDSTDGDAAVRPDASARDASAPRDAAASHDAAPASDGGGEAAPPRCGDVVADTSQPPLRAIERLATTQEEVRILVYGQSISEGSWWLEVRDWLRAQYPRGNLVMEEHARGGCAAQCLIGREAWFADGQARNRVPEDVFAFEPDLVVFHAFGRHDDYASLVHGLAAGCAAFAEHPVATARCPGSQLFPEYEPPEILLQTYHRIDDRAHDLALPMEPPVPEGEWDAWMSTVWIPAVAERHGARVVDVWHPWGAYLREHALPASALLEDEVHLAEEGNRLLAALTKPALCHVPPGETRRQRGSP